MRDFVKRQNDLLDKLEEFKRDGNNLSERNKALTIYGYNLKELLDIIHYAKQHGYNPQPHR